MGSDIFAISSSFHASERLNSYLFASYFTPEEV